MPYERIGNHEKSISLPARGAAGLLLSVRLQRKAGRPLRFRVVPGGLRILCGTRRAGGSFFRNGTPGVPGEPDSPSDTPQTPNSPDTSSAPNPSVPDNSSNPPSPSSPEASSPSVPAPAFAFSAVTYPADAVKTLADRGISQTDFLRRASGGSYTGNAGYSGSGIILSPYFTVSISGRAVPAYGTTDLYRQQPERGHPFLFHDQRQP